MGEESVAGLREVDMNLEVSHKTTSIIDNKTDTGPVSDVACRPLEASVTGHPR